MVVEAATSCASHCPAIVQVELPGTASCGLLIARVCMLSLPSHQRWHCAVLKATTRRRPLCLWLASMAQAARRNSQTGSVVVVQRNTAC